MTTARLVGAILAFVVMSGCTSGTGSQPVDESSTVTGSQFVGESPPVTDSQPSTSSSAASRDQPAEVPPSESLLVDAVTCWVAPVSGSPGTLRLTDVTSAAGLTDALTGMHGHAIAAGDVDRDGFPELVVGSFADRPVERYAVRGATGPSPDRLLHSSAGRAFSISSTFPGSQARTSGAVFADLDLDGDLDLILSRNSRDVDRGGERSMLYRNVDGSFEAVTDSGLTEVEAGRSIGVLDVDGDGLPEVLILEDRWGGGRSVLHRNLGDLRFRADNEGLGFPDDVHGLGVATGDLNGDGFTDVVVAGSNRVFTGNGSSLEEALADELIWEVFGDEDDVAGADLGDIDGDGRLDLVLGQHFNSTLDAGTRVGIRLYLNRTPAPGDVPVFVDVSSEAGLVGLPTKAPHVQVADMDNDGLPDIVTSAAGSGPGLPMIFLNRGLDGSGLPRFEPWQSPGSRQYWVSAPVTDMDRDGRLDVVLLEWEPTLPSLLLRNETDSGHWLSVSVGAGLGGGPGTRVEVYEAGRSGDPDRLVGMGEISLGRGYSAGLEPLLHLGLGDRTSVDLVVRPPQPHQPIRMEAVPVDRHLRLPDGCADRSE